MSGGMTKFSNTDGVDYFQWKKKDQRRQFILKQLVNWAIWAFTLTRNYLTWSRKHSLRKFASKIDKRKNNAVKQQSTKWNAALDFPTQIQQTCHVLKGKKKW